MTREMIELLTPGETERAYYSYRGICDIYEELYGGPNGAAKYREYIIADRAAMLLWNRLKSMGVV